MQRHHLKHAVNVLRICRRWMEHAAELLPNSQKNAGSAAASAHRTIHAGLWLIVAVFGVMGVWSATAPLDSAAIAPGQVVFDANKKTIQHLEGGIVEEIMVREGQLVESGEPLIRLHGTAFKSKLTSLKAHYITAQAMEERLKAQQAFEESLVFTDSLVREAEGDASKQALLANQKELFASQRKAYDAQIQGILKKIEGFRHDIKGLETQEKAGAKQIALLEEEITSAKRLLAKGYASKPRVLALERQLEETRGQHGQYLSSIGHSEQNIAEAEQQMIAIKQESLARSAAELKDVQSNIAELNEQLRASKDAVERIVIASPISGFVTGLNVHTVGGVIAPGEKVMDIIPSGEKLIIEAQISPQDIDMVHAGLKANIHLSAYRSRFMPTIEGKVLNVSADRITDARNNTSYFLTRIEVNQAQLKDMKNITLYPGMPAEALIVTGERTLLGYLFLPISEAMRRAFRED